MEMVESVDDLECWRSIRGTPGPNFELLDVRIASALNKIIQNNRFKKKVSLEEMKAHKEDWFLRGRQIAFLIFEYFRVTGANDSVDNYADLFTVVLRNDDVQEFDSKSVKSIPPKTENSMQYGYDENDNNNRSNETKRETNYSHHKVE